MEDPLIAETLLEDLAPNENEMGIPAFCLSLHGYGP